MASSAMRTFSWSASTSLSGPFIKVASMRQSGGNVNAPVAPRAWPMQRLSPVLVEIGTKASMRMALRTVHGTMHAATATVTTAVDRSTTRQSWVATHQARAMTGKMASEMGRTITARPSVAPAPRTRHLVNPSGHVAVASTARNPRNKKL